MFSIKKLLVLFISISLVLLTSCEIEERKTDLRFLEEVDTTTSDKKDEKVEYKGVKVFIEIENEITLKRNNKVLKENNISKDDIKVDVVITNTVNQSDN